MKNALKGLRNRADQMEERISDVKERKLQIMQLEKERGLRFKAKGKRTHRHGQWCGGCRGGGRGLNDNGNNTIKFFKKELELGGGRGGGRVSKPYKNYQVE